MIKRKDKVEPSKKQLVTRNLARYYRTVSSPQPAREILNAIKEAYDLANKPNGDKVERAIQLQLEALIQAVHDENRAKAKKIEVNKVILANLAKLTVWEENQKAGNNNELTSN